MTFGFNVFTNENGNRVYVSFKPTRKELERLNIDILLKLAKKHKSGLKGVLINHLLGEENK